MVGRTGVPRGGYAHGCGLIMMTMMTMMILQPMPSLENPLLLTHAASKLMHKPRIH